MTVNAGELRPVRHAPHRRAESAERHISELDFVTNSQGPAMNPTLQGTVGAAKSKKTVHKLSSSNFSYFLRCCRLKRDAAHSASLYKLRQEVLRT